MKVGTRVAAGGVGALLGALLLLGSGCSGPGARFSKSQTLGGKRVSARRLNHGRELFVTYCAACHGLEGDGKGPAAVGLRPPPRNFKQGQFKFAAVASGQLPNDEASMSKLYNSELAQRLAQTAMQALGLRGALTEGGDEASYARQYMGVVPATIRGGTSEVQRNVIATRGLGLPRG